MRFDVDQLYKLKVAQYRQALSQGILDANWHLELLEGIMYENMPRNARDSSASRAFETGLSGRLPADWSLLISQGIPLAEAKPESQPEPDYALVRAEAAGANTLLTGDIALVVEFASSNPDLERVLLGRIYARAGIPIYWICDFGTRTIEVYTQPTGAIDSPHYANRDKYPLGTSVPVVLDGNTVGTIAVSDVVG